MLAQLTMFRVGPGQKISAGFLLIATTIIMATESWKVIAPMLVTLQIME